MKYERGAIVQDRQSLRDFSMEGKVVPVELLSGRSITLARDGVGIHSNIERGLSWTRDEAIVAAKSILEYYDETP